MNIFTNNFATTCARDINNTSILMFSGLRYRSETAANNVLADSFLCILMLGCSPMVISGPLNVNRFINCQ